MHKGGNAGKCNNSYNSLLECSTQPCDFCNKIFRNRFDSIIHNASHIIIPLIKLKYCRCNKCYHTFSSPRDLDAHLDTVHHIKNCGSRLSKKKSKIKLNILDQYEAEKEVKENSIHNIRPESIDESSNVREKIIQNSNLNTRNKTNANKSSTNRKFIFNSDIDCNLNNNDNKDDTNKFDINVNFNTIEKIEEDSIKIKLEDTEDDDYQPKIDEKESIKSRLRFEDDEIYDNCNVLNGLITECKVEMCDLPFTVKPGLLTSHKVENDIKTNEINKQLYNGFNEFKNFKQDCESQNKDSHINGRMQSLSQQTGEIRSQIVEPEYKSIHYRDLMKPGIFNCRYCLKSHPDRFNLIKHETDHIKFKKNKISLCTYCDKYIAGNYHSLHRHMKTIHPTVKVNKNRETHKCKECRLKYYNYSRHMMNYHPTDCPEVLKEDHEKNLFVTTKPVISNVCDLCYAFMKVTKKCILKDSISQPGVRHQCERCGKKFFELKTVEHWIHQTYHRRTYCRRVTKKLSNEDRLKKLQRRLKKINNLNKFYTAVLFRFLYEFNIFQTKKDISPL